jgi:hypothetical protein
VAKRRGSAKPAVIEYLYEKWRQGDFVDNVIRRKDIRSALEATGSTLSDGNIANFLKDLIRKKTIVENWPSQLSESRVSARQRYGDTRVFEFFEHPEEWESPFPDWHAPDEATPVYTIQSVSIDAVARDLGRVEETWLTQIAVNLHLVHTQLSIFSPSKRNIRDVRHLQMGIKTQPEIDAAFLATYRGEDNPLSIENVFVTVEAKQRDERILLDQIREQVAKAMTITRHLKDPPIHSVKPMALQVVRWPHSGAEENMIFLVEFQGIDRTAFVETYESQGALGIYDLTLEQVSCALYRLEPRIPAIG